MAEPHASAASAAGGAVGSSFGIGLVGALANPVAQHWTLIGVGLVAGAILAVQAAKTAGLRASFPVFCKALLIGGVFSGLCATALAPRLGVSTDVLLMPVAAFIAWHHERIGPALALAMNWAASKLSKKGAE